MELEELYTGLFKVLETFTEDFYPMDYTQDYGVDLRATFIDTLQLSKTGYRMFEKLADKVFETPNFKVSTCCDVSGHNYWSCFQEESNYLHVSVGLKPNSTEYTQEDLDKLYDIFNDISREYDSIAYKHTLKKYRV